MLSSQALRERSLAVLGRDEQRQRAGMLVVADLQNQPRILGERRRNMLRDARQFERFVARCASSARGRKAAISRSLPMYL